MHLDIENDQFDINQLLRKLKSKREQMESAIDLLQNMYELREPISPEELEELEATIIDNFWIDFPELAYAAAQKAEQEAKRGFIPNVNIRIDEGPLTLQNLATMLSALTELSTKYWLISQGRFADLINYTQTHDPGFAEAAHVIINEITHNSPVNFDVRFDASATNVAEAVINTIDGVMQAKLRLAKSALENQNRALEIEQARQKSEQESHMAVLEREKQKLEVERQRLELIEKQLDVQKKSVEYALELASKIVDSLRPGIDIDTRAMAIQLVLPNILQLQNVKGLEILLPAPPSERQQNQ